MDNDIKETIRGALQSACDEIEWLQTLLHRQTSSGEVTIERLQRVIALLEKQ